MATLGYLYHQYGKTKEALDASLKAVEIDPRIVKAHSLLSLIYYNSGRIQQAIDENMKILQMNPNNVPAHRNLAIMYEQGGQADKAVSHMKRVVELSPESEKPQLIPLLDRLTAKAGGRTAGMPAK